MGVTTRQWDPVEHLAGPEEIAGYLAAALEDGDPQLIAAALGDVARARGMSQLARDAGMSRESLCWALSGVGNPEFGTILRVLRALGLRLTAVPEEPRREVEET